MMLPDPIAHYVAREFKSPELLHVAEGASRRRRDIAAMIRAGPLSFASGPLPLVTRVFASAIAGYFWEIRHPSPLEIILGDRENMIKKIMNIRLVRGSYDVDGTAVPLDDDAALLNTLATSFVSAARRSGATPDPCPIFVAVPHFVALPNRRRAWVIFPTFNEATGSLGGILSALRDESVDLPRVLTRKDASMEYIVVSLYYAIARELSDMRWTHPDVDRAVVAFANGPVVYDDDPQPLDPFSVSQNMKTEINHALLAMGPDDPIAVTMSWKEPGAIFGLFSRIQGPRAYSCEILAILMPVKPDVLREAAPPTPPPAGVYAKWS